MENTWWNKWSVSILKAGNEWKLRKAIIVMIMKLSRALSKLFWKVPWELRKFLADMRLLSIFFNWLAWNKRKLLEKLWREFNKFGEAFMDIEVVDFCFKLHFEDFSSNSNFNYNSTNKKIPFAPVKCKFSFFFFNFPRSKPITK